MTLGFLWSTTLVSQRCLLLLCYFARAVIDVLGSLLFHVSPGR